MRGPSRVRACGEAREPTCLPGALWFSRFIGTFPFLSEFYPATSSSSQLSNNIFRRHPLCTGAGTRPTPPSGRPHLSIRHGSPIAACSSDTDKCRVYAGAKHQNQQKYKFFTPKNPENDRNLFSRKMSKIEDFQIVRNTAPCTARSRAAPASSRGTTASADWHIGEIHFF